MTRMTAKAINIMRKKISPSKIVEKKKEYHCVRSLKIRSRSLRLIEMMDDVPSECSCRCSDTVCDED